MYKCELCNIEFKTFQEKGNHHRWKHLNYAFKNKETKENYKNIFLDKWKFFEVSCYKCGKTFKVKEYNIDKPKKEKYYCSRICANSHIRTENSKQKTSNIFKQKIRNGEEFGWVKKGYILVDDALSFCQECNKKVQKRKQKFCSIECRKKYHRKKLSNYKNYRLDCHFNFSLNDYPEEFDFSLIEKYGWYSASNHGNNLNGISRDHMFSISEGFKQNIDPQIIKHPANCKLMKHTDNSKKWGKSSLNINELKNRIEIWNKKYNIAEE